VGWVEEGLDALAKALTLVNKTGERHHEAELYRLRGELTLARSSVQGLESSVQNPQAVFCLPSPSGGNPQLEAETCFLKAIEIAQKQQHSREEWRTRGIAGRVSAISQETKEVKVITSSTAGQPPVTLAITGKTVIRRYASDSIEYSDSRPSSLQELKVGDQLRALGEKSADGLSFTPEVIISGSFRMVGGAVTAIDVATREITINDIPTKKPVKITINEKSMLRRVPAELVNALKQKSTRSNSARPRPPANASKPADAKSSSDAGDMQDLFEQFPAITIGDIKSGIMILVASSMGEDPSRVTAIMLATGLDTLFNRPAGQPRPSQLLGPVGLPSGIFDSLIGVQ